MPKPQAVVDPKACQPEKCGVGPCAAARVCEKRALKQEAPYEIPYVHGLCLGCAQCVLACPFGAIRLI